MIPYQFVLAESYYYGLNGVQQDHAKSMELFTRATELGFTKAHCNLGGVYHRGGNMKKAKFHFVAGAMAGHETARYILGVMEGNSGNIERALKHWIIAASAGCYNAMHQLTVYYEKGDVSRDSIDSTLTAYNNSCADMRSKARDAAINKVLTDIENEA